VPDLHPRAAPKRWIAPAWMDALRETSLAHAWERLRSSRWFPFRKRCLDNIRRNGRLNELELIARFKADVLFHTGRLAFLFKDASLAPQLAKTQETPPPSGKSARPPRWLRRIFRARCSKQARPMNIGLLSGCALHGSSNDYEQSLRACLGALDVQLQEVKDWICCGATAAHSLNHKLSLALPARNLALAERDGFQQLFAPCPLCSMQLVGRCRRRRRRTASAKNLAQIIERMSRGDGQVLNLIQLFERVGLDRLRRRLKKH